MNTSRAGTRGWSKNDAPDHRGPGWPVNGATCFYPPLRGLTTHLREQWRNRRACDHAGWTPAGGCGCGKW